MDSIELLFCDPRKKHGIGPADALLHTVGRSGPRSMPPLAWTSGANCLIARRPEPAPAILLWRISAYMAAAWRIGVIALRGAACMAAVAIASIVCAPALPGEAYAQPGQEQVPAWVKQVFMYYVDGQISEAELLAALAFLIDNGIIDVEAPGGSAGDRGMADEGDFYVEYGANPSAPYAWGDSAAAYLRDTRLLEDNAEWLSANYKLPYDVGIMGAECGMVNAFYSPDEKSITICYEIVDATLDAGYDLYDGDPAMAEDFAYNVLDGILLHETGHALVDIYDLPVTGLEEDAVDQFSALIQSRTYGDYDPYYETGRIMMLDMADWWSYSAQDEPPYYWDVHSLSIQRFYNIACYAYGADPEYNDALVGGEYLPEYRAATCPQEYEQLSSSWDRLLEGYLVE